MKRTADNTTIAPHRCHDDQPAIQAARLRQAASIVEDSAYDMAAEQPRAIVSGLIVIAAELERHADRLDKRSSLS